MHDADAGRYNFKGIEGLHAPFEELITFAIACEFDFHVLPQRIGRAVFIDHDRVIDHQINRHKGLNDFRIVPLAFGGIAH